jgi:hypothetical protein
MICEKISHFLFKDWMVENYFQFLGGEEKFILNF